MTITNPLITTATIDALVRGVNAAYKAAPTYQLDLRPWRAGTVARLHSITKLSRRRYAVCALAPALTSTLAELAIALSLAQAASGQQATISAQAAEIVHLQAEVQRLQIALDRRPPAITEITIPAQVLRCSPIQQQTLRSIGATGLGRAWRIAEWLVADGQTASRRSGDNAIGALVRAGLLADYEERGETQRWTAGPGGTRRLVLLTEAGRTFYRAAFGAEPVASEIPAAARQHASVKHAIAILEATHGLRAAGCQIDNAPPALLADPADPLGERSQPDLVLIAADGVRWPVEVQREVHARRVAKLAKALELGDGRLILILFHEAKRERQQAIIELIRAQLPPGVIRLTSLAALDRPPWTWHELRTGCC